MQAQLVEPEAKHFRSTLRGEAASLGVRVEAPADLALAALDVPQSEHELADRPPDVAGLGDQDEGVTIRLEMPLPEALIELGSGLVEVHRRPWKKAADILATEHRVEEREIARLVRAKGQPRRPDRVRGSEHPPTIPGPRPRASTMPAGR
jgi:hypothetical protein